MFDIKEGLTSNGVPGGERELRPPKKQNYDPISEALHYAGIAILAIFSGLATSIWRTFCRLLFHKPVSLKGKVCFVTGSGRGLGREICLALAREGATVACAEINDVTNSETLELIKKEGGKAVGYKLNVANKQEVEEAAGKVEKELGPVYLVVNNAAIVMPVKDPTEEFIRASFNVNVLGYFWVTGAFLPYLKDRNEGHIINIGSISSYFGFPFITTYSSTKAAIQNYSKALGLQLQVENPNNNVRISCINPTFLNSTEDYLDILQSSTVVSSLNAVVDKLLRIVKSDWFYNISTPFYIKYGLYLFQVLPDDCFLYFMKKVLIGVLFPNQEEFKNLPSGRLVSLCSGAGSKEKNK